MIRNLLVEIPTAFYGAVRKLFGLHPYPYSYYVTWEGADNTKGGVAMRMKYPFGGADIVEFSKKISEEAGLDAPVMITGIYPLWG